MRKKKKSLFFIIALLVMCFGIGYAYLTTTLSINGVTDVDANNWDVYFDNIQVTSGSVSGSQVIDAAEVVDDTTVSFHVNLKEPGDFYEFTVDAKNDGTIDAMINSIAKKVNGVTTIPAYLNYSVTYADDLEIANNHLLAAESLETYKVRVGYRTDIDPSDLPSTAQSLTLSFNAEYVQADENAIEALKIVYSDYTAKIGSTIPQSVRLYDAANDFSPVYGMYFKYSIKNYVVRDAYVGIVMNGEEYYLQGGGATYNDSTGTYNDDSIYYDSNLAVLHSAFGEENCSERNQNGDIYYRCELGNNRGIIKHSGNVAFANNSGSWEIEPNGTAFIDLTN